MGKGGGFLLVLLLILIPVVSASTAFYVPQNSNYSIRFGCELDNTICTDSALCNVSIYFSNSTPVIRNNVASNIGNGEFQKNITYNLTSQTGEYKLKMDCYDAGVNGSSTVFYEVNPSGIRSSQDRTDTISRSIYFMLIIAILLFLAFLFVNSAPPTKWTYFALSVLFFLISINLIFTSLQDETINPKLETFFNSFTAMSWYFYWFIGGILILLWGFTFINTWIYKKNLENARKYGLA